MSKRRDQPYVSKVWGHTVRILSWRKPHHYKPEREPVTKLISLDEYQKRAENVNRMEDWIASRKFQK